MSQWLRISAVGVWVCAGGPGRQQPDWHALPNACACVGWRAFKLRQQQQQHPQRLVPTDPLIH
jgi:hypothetical protein